MMDWSAQNPSRFAGASDVLAIWEVGSGQPVLLVHGFPDHPIGLEPLAKALAETGHRCIVPALPGYFPSSPLEHGDYTSDRVGQTLIGLLDDLGIDRVAYVGHDWGAEIGFPLIVKAAFGGGGRGMRVVENPEEFAVLLCHIAEIETLYLGPDLHRRAKFGADNTWAGQWLAP